MASYHPQTMGQEPDRNFFTSCHNCIKGLFPLIKALFHITHGGSTSLTDGLLMPREQGPDPNQGTGEESLAAFLCPGPCVETPLESGLARSLTFD